MSPFRGTHNQNVKVNGCKVCITTDKIPLVNIPEFGMCEKTGNPCVPAPIAWTDTYKVKVKGQQTLLFKSKLPCSVSGKIEFITSGQVPISQEELDKLNEENAEEPQEEEEGLSWWDAVEMVPFVGGVVGAVRSGAKGDWLGLGLSVASLGLDIAGLFSFGGGNVASAAVKGGKLARAGAKVVKAANKVGKVGKAALTAGGKLLTKKGAKIAAKALATKIDDIAKATGKVCVFACFPAGTPVHTQNGLKNIEDIQLGDLVWAQNEETREIALQKVTAVFSREVDATVLIELEGETVETTAEHPFYTQEGWKDAADLTPEDTVQTKDQQWHKVKGQNFLYQKKKVYNFEVENWHTYFVGIWAWLVHNAQVCITGTIKGLIGNRALRDLTHNELYNAFKKSGIELTSHAVKRLKDIRTKNLGFITPNDIMKVINNGSRKVVEQVVKRNGKDVIKKTVEVTHGRLKVVFEKGTNKIITIMPS